MNQAAFYSQQFGNLQIAAASLLIFAAVLISRFLKLNIGKDLFVAALRTTAQLIAVGYILRWLLHVNSLWTNLFTLAVMTLIAAQAIHSRLREKTWKVYFLSVLALLGSVWPLGLLSIEVFFGGEAFTEGLFFIPYMGVLMGNALASISLTFVGLERHRRESLLEIETHKALGATSFEACQRLYNETLRSALTPIINGMSVVGIVSLPGVMAGQLIGGVDPLVAARFQILVMFLISFTAMIGSLLGIYIHHRSMMPAWVHQSNPNLSLDLKGPEKIWLQGPSGVGKSRLLKSLVGLDIPEIKDHVKLHEGLQWAGLQTERASAWIAYVPQKSYFTPGTVLENLQRPFEFKRYRQQSFSGDFIAKHLPLLGLEADILKKDAMTLSGGEGQIIHLLRTLQFAPQVLFLDEITASLDHDRTAKVEAFLNDWLHQAENRQIVFISHRPASETAFHSRILRLEHGRLFLQ